MKKSLELSKQRSSLPSFARSLDVLLVEMKNLKAKVFASIPKNVSGNTAGNGGSTNIVLSRSGLVYLIINSLSISYDS
jgi:hypothetical protein